MGKIRTHICKELSGGLKQIHVVTNNRSSNMDETETYADNNIFPCTDNRTNMTETETDTDIGIHTRADRHSISVPA